MLARRVRAHVNYYHTARGTTVELREMFKALPEATQVDLAISLRFADWETTDAHERRGYFSRVPFFASLHAQDLILYVLCHPDFPRSILSDSTTLA